MPISRSLFRAPPTVLLFALLARGSWLLAPAGAHAQDDPFVAGVRTTPWLSPADEQKHFQLPPGFEINLVAAEPEIQKPLNMAFDERGRIWLTCSVEYPYAAPPDRPGKDTIKVLEDADGDGRYEKITTFADGLNIPMGIYPWKGGCVAFSIPNIWHFEDTDGDGECDKRTVLYGPFDTSRDTHGMVNSFRRGWDGWIYACHGFNNDSRVRGTDGHEIHMQSGNVFRFQLDGSRVEHFTHGQVNPFGMCFDELFNIFTADCHSKPIYQLLRGGYYPSFGKPHDGLGFVPPMMDHVHGSTAICGLVKYSGENFPEEYRGDFYSGNVMTSRINRNKPEYRGSTIKASEQPDFLTTTDPWFRPVDIHVGPDGAMYILDFYNRIIGHYEVPLPHPGRDRTSGRIWRVAYKTPSPLVESGVRNAPAVRQSVRDMQKLAELSEWSDAQRQSALDGLLSNDPYATRAAADALGRHPRPTQVRKLIDRLKSTPDDDTHLRHTIRMAIRDHVVALPSASAVEELKLSDADSREVAAVCVAIPAPIAAQILVRYVEIHDDNRLAYIQHAARYADENLVAKVIGVAKTTADGDTFAQGQAIQSLATGLAQRRKPDVDIIAAWAEGIATTLLDANDGEAPRKLLLAADIVGKLKLQALRPQLASLVAGSATEVKARTSLAQALIALDPDARAAALAAALADPSIPNEMRPRIGYAITVRNENEYLDNLREVMKRAPTRLQGTLAETLAGDAAGASSLLTVIESGHAAPRVLQLPNVSNKLKAQRSDDINQRIAAITAKLPPTNAVLDALITDRRRAYAGSTKSVARGQVVYEKHCTACHKIADKGSLVGPQLDGIGNRGIDRLLEDVLDPNRNVDVAFRTTTLRLADGRILSGLVRREEGDQLILADPQGKEFSVAKSDIDEQQKTPLSLMPANVSEIVPANEFADLMAYLLGQRSASK